MNEFKHKKSLGQHFLKDKNIIRKIVDAADINEGEAVWEVGPGKGSLTEELLYKKCKLTCFEIDKTLYDHLETKFKGQFSLVKADVLKIDWQTLFPEEKIKIVANLPYQITSPFLFKVAGFAHHFSRVVIMIQKEVAERINAKLGTKDYGILTLKMNYYFKVRYEFTVKRHLFYPVPRVDSAVISLEPRKDKPQVDNLDLFWKLVETSFRNRRKMLRKNLLNMLSKEKLEKNKHSCPIELTRRGETLTESEFVELYNWVTSI